MADIRIKDLATTASSTAADDFLAVDGTTNGTRKLSAATPSFATSVTVPGVAGPTATDLTLAGGSTGASLVLGQGATGTLSFTNAANGQVTFNMGVGKFRVGGNGLATPIFMVRKAASGAADSTSEFAFENSSDNFLALLGGTANNIGLRFGSSANATSAGYIAGNTTSGANFLSFGLGASEVARYSTNLNLLIGTTTDGGQKLQVNGTAAFAGAVTTGVVKVGTGIAGFAEFSNSAFWGTTDYALVQNSSGATQLNAALGQDVTIHSNRNVLAARFSNGAATFAGAVIAPAATTAISSVRLPHGTAPTSPVNGDMWTTTAGLYVRINGVTVGPLS